MKILKSEASPTERLAARLSIISELLPVSAGDAKDAAKAIDSGIDSFKGASKGCGCCFVAGTPVKNSDGSTAIEDVQIGDYVWARDSKTGHTSLKEVTNIIITEGKPLYAVKLVESDGTEEIIQVTDNHPFWIKSRGWVNTIDLKPGMLVEQYDGTTVRVESVEALGNKPTTYNLTVDDYHSYFAGELEALVHNCGCAFSKGVNYKSVKQFGHTFKTHGAGAKNTAKLQDRAAGTGNNQGQFLNNEKAAEYLAEFKDISEPKVVSLPSGLGQVIKPDGSISQASNVQIVPKAEGGFKTAYPVE